MLRPNVDDLRVDLAGVQPLQGIHQSFTGRAVAAAVSDMRKRTFFFLPVDGVCACAVLSDVTAAAGRDVSVCVPRVGPGDTHILRPREVLDCIDAGPSADATPAEGRRAAQEREARSETHVDAYGGGKAKVSGGNKRR